jgi:hypothetical protein
LLGGGQLVSSEQRKKLEEDPNAGKGFYSASEDGINVYDVLERLAKAKSATLQDVVSVAAQQTCFSKLMTSALALAYLFISPQTSSQSWVWTVEHVKLLPAAMSVKLPRVEIDEIHGAARLNPLFSNTFPFDGKYNTRLTVADETHHQMAT